ncbi:MAG: tRNA modification GTPase [Candidatus Atribacteria bacterium]|nr:tRNA modification GTPase [Candidatus Atribacteria bacterium]
MGEIQDPASQQGIDQALVVVMRAPRSYTREDVVEFQFHGGVLLAQKIVELCLREGARLAHPGEFTQRAFLNGRIDLTQAEAVAEIVGARSQRALELAHRNLKGNLRDKIKSWQKTLLAIEASIQAQCDFLHSEEMANDYLAELQSLYREMEAEVKKSEKLRPFQQGATVAIVGKPNTGKSSLLNQVAGREKAIVTSFPGTTRDAIEESLIYQGTPLRLIDTAGLRESQEEVEWLGIEKTKKIIHESDFILALLDQSQPLSAEDWQLLELIQNRPHFLVLNKIDLPPKIELSSLKRTFPEEEFQRISALSGEGVEALLDKLVLKVRNIFSFEGEAYLLTLRQQAEIKKTLRLIEEAWQSQKEGLTLDVLGLLIEEALKTLMRLTGESWDKRLLESIFSQFCLGK